MRRVILALAAGALVAGCTMKKHGVPGANPEFAKADYTVLGKTNHEECGTYILGIDWGHLFANQKAAVSGGGGGLLDLLPFGGMGPEESRAMYHALDKMPEATHLMAHRSHTTASGVLLGMFPIFGERCSSVEARGVKIGDKPAGPPGQPPA
jgi:hypothetical protein